MKRRHFTTVQTSKNKTGNNSSKRLKLNSGNYVTKIDNQTWNSASSVQNYMLKDPILDWFKWSKPVRGSSNDTKFVNFLMSQGNKFEQYVMSYISTKFGPQNIVKVSDNYEDIISVAKYLETIQLMKQGVPLIYQGVLHNPTNQTYGSPDILIRSDYINDLVSCPVISTRDMTKKASKLQTAFHYRVVDIKFTTLRLRADGIHLLNSGRSPCNKAQVMIYNTALGLAQGYLPRQCYILGRGYTYTSKGRLFSSKKCDSKLGAIDVTGIDIDYNKRISKALTWVSDVKTNGKKWSVYPSPTVKELYPNMCNTYDFPYHEEKKEIASKLSEITELWQCGVKNRESCLAYGISSWKDTRCTVDTLNFTGEKRSPIVEKMLEFNQGKIHPHCKVIPQYIQNNWLNWRSQNMKGGGPDDNSHCLEFFLDFENATNILDTMENIPRIGANNIVFMIGLGYIDPNTGIWKYHNFTARKLDLESEYEIFNKMHKVVNKLKVKYNTPDPNFYHWGHVENSLYDKVFENHAHARDISHWIKPTFLDFLKVFKDEIILVKGVLNFGLKNIAAGMSKHDLIDLKWENDGCSDGLSAMIQAGDCYKQIEKSNICVVDIPDMQSIIRYNEIDCKMIREIMHYLRINHSKSKPMTIWDYMTSFAETTAGIIPRL